MSTCQRSTFKFVVVVALALIVLYVRFFEKDFQVLPKLNGPNFTAILEKMTNDSQKWEWMSQSRPENSIQKYNVDRWQYMGNKTLLYGVYSAYFDERLEIFGDYNCSYDHICYGSIRMVTLLPKDIKTSHLDCHYKYSDGHVTKAKAVRATIITDYQSHQTFIVVCVLMQNIHTSLEVPESVGLSYDLESSMVNATLFTYIRYPTLLDPSIHSQDQINKLAICVPAFFNYKNSLRIVEFVELYKILGVSKFYFYNLSVSEDVNKLLNYYQENENVTVLEWNTQDYQGWTHIYYEAISACFSECYLRVSFMDNYKYVLLLDIDEIIMPQMANVTTLPDLMSKMDTDDSINSFNVQNVFMTSNSKDKTDKEAEKFVNKNLLSQKNLARTNPYSHHSRSKMIAKGKFLNLLSNHHYLESAKFKKERLVQANEALLFHYRDQSLAEKHDVTDKAALKYANQLRPNVDKVCKEVYPEVGGVCPVA